MNLHAQFLLWPIKKFWRWVSSFVVGGILLWSILLAGHFLFGSGFSDLEFMLFPGNLGIWLSGSIYHISDLLVALCFNTVWHVATAVITWPLVYLLRRWSARHELHAAKRNTASG